VAQQLSAPAPEPGEETGRFALGSDLLGDGDLPEPIDGVGHGAGILASEAASGAAGAPGEPVERLRGEVEEGFLTADRWPEIVVHAVAERRPDTRLEPVEVDSLRAEHRFEKEGMEAEPRPVDLAEGRDQRGVLFDRSAARRRCGKEVSVGKEKTDGWQGERLVGIPIDDRWPVDSQVEAEVCHDTPVRKRVPVILPKPHVFSSEHPVEGGNLRVWADGPARKEIVERDLLMLESLDKRTLEVFPN